MEITKQDIGKVYSTYQEGIFRKVIHFIDEPTELFPVIAVTCDIHGKEIVRVTEKIKRDDIYERFTTYGTITAYLNKNKRNFKAEHKIPKVSVVSLNILYNKTKREIETRTFVARESIDLDLENRERSNYILLKSIKTNVTHPE
jgi:hypothetical protein